MHTYTWLKKFDIGVAAIDSEHHNLLACINKLILAQGMDESMLDRLSDEVVSYAEFHILSEENLMALTGYPGLDKHHQAHQKLLKELKVFHQKFAANKEHLKEFVTFLAKWLIEHSQSVDREFGDYLDNYHPPKDSPEEKIKALSMS